MWAAASSWMKKSGMGVGGGLRETCVENVWEWGLAARLRMRKTLGVDLGRAWEGLKAAPSSTIHQLWAPELWAPEFGGGGQHKDSRIGSAARHQNRALWTLLAPTADWAPNCQIDTKWWTLKHLEHKRHQNMRIMIPVTPLETWSLAQYLVLMWTGPGVVACNEKRHVDSTFSWDHRWSLPTKKNHFCFAFCFFLAYHRMLVINWQLVVVICWQG